MSPPIVLFSYDFSPYGQKVRQALSAAGLPFKQCDQPMMLPRPDLTALGIAHRRIPILAIGKDVYCDSAAAVDALEGLSSAMQSSPADKAFEAYGNSLIGVMLRSVDVDSMPGLVQDRATIFKDVARPDHATLRASALSELKISRIPLPKVEDKISAEEVSAYISGPEAPQLSLSETDLHGIPTGTKVVVETVDPVPGSHPQYGNLLRSTRHEVVIEIENGLRLHFPKRGFTKAPERSIL
ncbi:hypothetical protein LQW54_007308 [Pestalotiopsis sp. IQ-011]